MKPLSETFSYSVYTLIFIVMTCCAVDTKSVVAVTTCSFSAWYILMYHSHCYLDDAVLHCEVSLLMAIWLEVMQSLIIATFDAIHLLPVSVRWKVTLLQSQADTVLFSSGLPFVVFCHAWCQVLLLTGTIDWSLPCRALIQCWCILGVMQYRRCCLLHCSSLLFRLYTFTPSGASLILLPALVTATWRYCVKWLGGPCLLTRAVCRWRILTYIYSCFGRHLGGVERHLMFICLLTLFWSPLEAWYFILEVEMFGSIQASLMMCQILWCVVLVWT